MPSAGNTQLSLISCGSVGGQPIGNACCGSNEIQGMVAQSLTADRRSLIPGVTFRSLAARITHPGLQPAATP